MSSQLEGEDLFHHHKIHRAAMKAALGIETRDHPDDALLLKRTGQSSVHKMALRATAGLAWRCAQSWQNHPLTGGHIEEQQPKKVTRQASSREFPPQSEKTLLVSRLVETWEKIPDHIKKTEKESVAKKKIKSCLKFSSREIHFDTYLDFLMKMTEEL
jgi:hypothetical protein